MKLKGNGDWKKYEQQNERENGIGMKAVTNLGIAKTKKKELS